MYVFQMQFFPPIVGNLVSILHFFSFTLFFLFYFCFHFHFSQTCIKRAKPLIITASNIYLNSNTNYPSTFPHFPSTAMHIMVPCVSGKKRKFSNFGCTDEWKPTNESDYLLFKVKIKLPNSSLFRYFPFYSLSSWSQQHA